MAESGKDLSDELKNIVDEENLSELESFIEKLKAEDSEEAQALMTHADRYHEKFGRISRLSTAVMGISKADLTEVKSFANPPAGVIDTLKAFFIMMGHPKSEIQDYRVVKRLIGDAKALQKVQNVKLKDLSKEQTQAAKAILDKYTFDDIKRISKAAASFQQWCVGMIEESEDMA